MKTKAGATIIAATPKRQYQKKVLPPKVPQGRKPVVAKVAKVTKPSPLKGTKVPARMPDAVHKDLVFNLHMLADAVGVEARVDGMRSKDSAIDLLHSVYRKLHEKKFVYQVHLVINLPKQRDPNGDMVHDHTSYRISYVFSKYPDEYTIMGALTCDELLCKDPRFDAMTKQLSYCLFTWGVPKLTTDPVYGGHGDAAAYSVETKWLANITEGKHIAYGHEFGNIQIFRKSIL